MFRIFKKKKVPKNTRRPLVFPVLDPADVTTQKISELLTAGIPIWAWYNVSDLLEHGKRPTHESEIHALEQGCLDGFSMYRLEGDYICKYIADTIGEKPDLYLRLRTIWPHNSAAVYEVYCDLKAAYETSYDPEHRTDDVLAYAHDLDAEKIAAYLQDHPVMHVGLEHFRKREN